MWERGCSVSLVSRWWAAGWDAALGRACCGCGSFGVTDRIRRFPLPAHHLPGPSVLSSRARRPGRASIPASPLRQGSRPQP
jgi:hypothetical protein